VDVRASELLERVPHGSLSIDHIVVAFAQPDVRVHLALLVEVFIDL
jgi:hypothetical protein